AGPPAEFAHLYPDVLEDVNADDLARIAAVVLRPPPLVDLSHVTPIRYTMAEAVEAVRDHMGRLGQASFRDLVADCDERIQIVVRFLALLELYREGMVDLAQAATFGEIHIRWEGEAALTIGRRRSDRSRRCCSSLTNPSPRLSSPRRWGPNAPRGTRGARSAPVATGPGRPASRCGTGPAGGDSRRTPRPPRSSSSSCSPRGTSG